MKKIFSILFIIVLTGCSQKNKIPKGILSQQQMRVIMWDMIRIDEYFNLASSSNDTTNRNKERISFYEQIFRMHSTNQSEFKKSIAFYQSRPDLFKVISDSLRINEQKVYDDQKKALTPIVDTVIKPSIIR